MPARRSRCVEARSARARSWLIQTVVEPGFREVAEFAATQGVECKVELELGGVQPRAMFCIRPSGRSIRYAMDADGFAVREIEGVHLRPLGQRMSWCDVDALRSQLTEGYARAAAAAIVQDHYGAVIKAAAEG